jgi:hypothetical protein
MIALSSLAGRRSRLVSFMELGLEADRTVIDLGGDGQVWYPNSVIVHSTNTARRRVSEALVPHDAKVLSQYATYYSCSQLSRVHRNGSFGLFG